MNSRFTSRRRSDDFQAALEASLDASDSRVAQHAEALALVGALRAVSPVEPRPDFVHDLRGRLMAEADTALATEPGRARASSPATPLRAPKRERRLAAAVGSFALVGATASMAVAAQGALPGETLYPLKRALENAQAGVQGDSDNKGTTLLANAAGRLAEIDQLSRDTVSQDPVVISSTLEEFSDQAVEASDLLMEAYGDSGQPEFIDDVRVFAAQSMGALRSLEPLVPRESRAALIQASQVLRQIDQTAMEACPTCSAAFLDQIPLLAATSYDDLVTDLVDATIVPVAPGNRSTTETKNGRDKKPKTTDEDKDSDAKPSVPAPSEPPASLPRPDSKETTSGPKRPKGPVEQLTEELLDGGAVKGPGLDDLLEDTTRKLTDPLLP